MVNGRGDALARVRRLIKEALNNIGVLEPIFRVKETLWARHLVDPDANGPETDDGLPIPPAKLVVLVGGPTTYAKFFHGGKDIANTIRTTLAAENVAMADLSAVLDFGCGCGRVIRHWHSLAPKVAIHGTDYNDELIGWCRTNLPFASFETNDLLPPLGYADGSFDLVYAFSVFTHLAERSQISWFAELARITRPGGYLIATVHCMNHPHDLTEKERELLAAGQLVVRYSSVEGTNLCAAFHSEPWLRRRLSDWEIIRIIPEMAGQDFVLLRRQTG